MREATCCRIHEIDELVSALPKKFFLAGHDWSRKRVGDETTSRLAVPTEHDVFENAHRAEQSEVLESAANSKWGHAVNWRPGQALAVEDDLALP